MNEIVKRIEDEKHAPRQIRLRQKSSLNKTSDADILEERNYRRSLFARGLADKYKALLQQ